MILALLQHNESANEPICAASGPSGACDRTTRQLMAKVMVDSLPARGLLQGVQDYVGLVMQLSAKHEAIGRVQDIVRKGR